MFNDRITEENIARRNIKVKNAPTLDSGDDDNQDGFPRIISGPDAIILECKLFSFKILTI